MITTDWLKEQGFKLEQYPDGMFWLLRNREELFLQADEALTNFSLYQDGWVDDHLTNEEVYKAVEQMKNLREKSE